VTDAGGSAAKQVADVDSMIAQGIDVLFLPPREESPLVPAVMRAKAAGVPVFLVDRSVDPAARIGKGIFLDHANGVVIPHGNESFVSKARVEVEVNIITILRRESNPGEISKPLIGFFLCRRSHVFCIFKIRCPFGKDG